MTTSVMLAVPNWNTESPRKADAAVAIALPEEEKLTLAEFVALIASVLLAITACGIVNQVANLFGG